MEIKKFKDYNEDELLDKLAKTMYTKYLETLKYYHNNPDKLKSDFKLHSETDFENQPKEKREVDYKWAKKVMDIINPYLNKDKK